MLLLYVCSRQLLFIALQQKWWKGFLVERQQVLSLNLIKFIIIFVLESWPNFTSFKLRWTGLEFIGCTLEKNPDKNQNEQRQFGHLITDELLVTARHRRLTEGLIPRHGVRKPSGFVSCVCRAEDILHSFDVEPTEYLNHKWEMIRLEASEDVKASQPAKSL